MKRLRSWEERDLHEQKYHLLNATGRGGRIEAELRDDYVTF